MSRRVLPLLLAALAVAPGQASGFEAAATLTGTARVVDGDGVRFGRVEVRLRGIAAPEDNAVAMAPGGPAATAALGAMAEGRQVTCRLDGTTTGRGTGNRPVAACAVGGTDLGEAMVRAGLARDCPRYSGGLYAEAERAARAAGRDLSRIYALPGYCRP